MTLTCDAGNGPMGKILNWCGVGFNPLGISQMYPAEAWLLLPNLAGTTLVVENRYNVAHAIPACYNTSLINVINATVSQDSNGGMVLEASWSRPRFLSDPELIAQGHMNLTGSVAGGKLGNLIAASSQAPNTAYAPCDVLNLEYHTYYDTSKPVDFDT